MESERFFIWDASTDQPIAVRFESLSESDREELESPNWAGAKFREVWLQSLDCGTSGTSASALKLVTDAGEPSGILGLLFIGVPRRAAYLKGSLLESSPKFRYRGGRPRIVRSIGRVLVARLILESERRGKHGKVQVTPIAGSEDFYTRLGFSSRRRGSGDLFCEGEISLQIVNEASNPSAQV